MAYQRVRRPEPKPKRESRLSLEAQKQIETLIYSLPAISLEKVLIQRAWDVGEITERTRYEHKEDSLDDPDYEGRRADEDSDFTEPPEEESPSLFDILPPPDKITVSPPVVDVCLEIMGYQATQKISLWSPLGALWRKLFMRDPIGGLYKRALEKRIRDLALIMRYLVAKNEGFFLNRQSSSLSPLTQKEVVTQLARDLRTKSQAVKGLVSRLVHSAYVQLPDGTVCALAQFFEREFTEPQTAYEMFFILATCIQEEHKTPLTDEQLAEKMQVKRSRVQKVRSAWLPNSRQRLKQYTHGKSLLDLLNITDSAKRKEIELILRGALEMAERRTDAAAQQAQRQLQKWLEQLKGMEAKLC
ncbi:MAG: hypothetical protein QW544_04150 [Candidatus Caldarchaeum sp.]